MIERAISRSVLTIESLWDFPLRRFHGAEVGTHMLIITALSRIVNLENLFLKKTSRFFQRPFGDGFAVMRTARA